MAPMVRTIHGITIPGTMIPGITVAGMIPGTALTTAGTEDITGMSMATTRITITTVEFPAPMSRAAIIPAPWEWAEQDVPA